MTMTMTMTYNNDNNNDTWATRLALVHLVFLHSSTKGRLIKYIFAKIDFYYYYDFHDFLGVK
jgi:hypothetical protein